MKTVVIGGTGLIGAKLVKNLREKGHEALPASPSSGVNTITGEGLAEALARAASLGNPIVQPSGIVSPTYGGREYAALTYPPLDNPTVSSARLTESGDFVGISRNGYACLAAPPPDSIASFDSPS